MGCQASKQSLKKSLKIQKLQAQKQDKQSTRHGSEDVIPGNQMQNLAMQVPFKQIIAKELKGQNNNGNQPMQELNFLNIQGLKNCQSIIVKSNENQVDLEDIAIEIDQFDFVPQDEKRQNQIQCFNKWLEELEQEEESDEEQEQSQKFEQFEYNIIQN